MDCLIQIKKVELEYIIGNSSPDNIGLTEIYPKTLFMTWMKTMRNFLSPIGTGHGVILYRKKKLLAKLMTLDTDFDESIWSRIHLAKTDQMLLGYLYRK